MICFLVSGDLVYGFGSARHGQIGNSVSKPQKSCNLPEVIQGFGSCKIVGLFANGDHSAALTGRCFWFFSYYSCPRTLVNVTWVNFYLYYIS